LLIQAREFAILCWRTSFTLEPAQAVALFSILIDSGGTRMKGTSKRLHACGIALLTLTCFASVSGQNSHATTVEIDAQTVHLQSSSSVQTGSFEVTATVTGTADISSFLVEMQTFLDPTQFQGGQPDLIFTSVTAPTIHSNIFSVSPLSTTVSGNFISFSATGSKVITNSTVGLGTVHFQIAANTPPTLLTMEFGPYISGGPFDPTKSYLKDINSNSLPLSVELDPSVFVDAPRTPEPSSLVLAGLGAMGLAVRSLRKMLARRKAE
jgi:PEP-CTERM motif